MDQFGVLFVVATPIGNMEDFSYRARQVLNDVDLIAAEDTRHSKLLLNRYEIRTKVISYHDHSDEIVAAKHINLLESGKSMALISDAGTPLISDPGFKLVRLARMRGISVIAIPGASAVTAALSISGLPSDRFAFEGFLPAKQSAREQKLLALAKEERTLVFYESPHRIEAAISSLLLVFGEDRSLFVGRELTKKFESHFFGSLLSASRWVVEDENNRKGEFVLVLAGSSSENLAQDLHSRAMDIAQSLLSDVSTKRAASLAAEITGARKNLIYKELLKLKESK